MNKNGRPYKYECKKCGSKCKVARSKKVSYVRRYYYYCTNPECGTKYTVDVKLEDAVKAYPPSLREVLMKSDAELDAEFGNPDEPRLTFTTWCTEIWTAYLERKANG